MLTQQGLRFFISSTSDLNEERQSVKAVIEALYHTPYDYTHDRPRLAGPERHLESRIRLCEGLVGVLGPRYGSEYPFGDTLEINGKPSRRMRRINKLRNQFHHPSAPCSIVEWEFHVAHYHGLEIMPFVKQLPDESYSDKRQRDFVHRLLGFRSEYWCGFYDDTADLEARVKTCLLKFNAEHIDRSRAQERAMRNALLITVSALLIVMIAFLGQALGTWTVSTTSSQLYLLFIVALSATILAIFRLRRPPR
jgi:hypothetical protein